MSYEDLYEARTKRAAMDEANEGRDKPSRKRKRLTSELDPRVTEPWQAPIARMVA